MQLQIYFMYTSVLPKQGLEANILTHPDMMRSWLKAIGILNDMFFLQNKAYLLKNIILNNYVRK